MSRHGSGSMCVAHEGLLVMHMGVSGCPVDANMIWQAGKP